MGEPSEPSGVAEASCRGERDRQRPPTDCRVRRSRCDDTDWWNRVRTHSLSANDACFYNRMVWIQHEDPARSIGEMLDATRRNEDAEKSGVRGAVGDQDRALEFYTNVIGLEKRGDYP